MHVAALTTAALSARATHGDRQRHLYLRQTSQSPTATNPRSTTQTTSYLALTTIWTPLASCSTDPFGRQDSSNAFRDFSAANRPCWPSAYTSHSFYSPGVCPSGFAIASQAVTSGVTSAWCCYPGFGLAQYGAPTDSACSSFVNTATSVAGGGSKARPTLSNFVARQWPIQVMWAKSDLDDFSPPSAPILAPTPTPTSAPPNNVTVSGTATPNDSPAEAAGLSTGAKAGIGAGIGLAILAALVLAGLFVMKRKRRQKAQFDPTAADICYRYEKPKDEDDNARHELPEASISLLDAKSGPHYELETYHHRSELEASEPIHNK